MEYTHDSSKGMKSNQNGQLTEWPKDSRDQLRIVGTEWPKDSRDQLRIVGKEATTTLLGDVRFWQYSSPLSLRGEYFIFIEIFFFFEMKKKKI